jgi:hypothetical protein
MARSQTNLNDIKDDANYYDGANNQAYNMNWVFQIHASGISELVAAFWTRNGLCGDIWTTAWTFGQK